MLIICCLLRFTDRLPPVVVGAASGAGMWVSGGMRGEGEN